MPKYITDVDRWISHESRLVKAGEEFDTEFPKGPDGKDMKLSDTLRLVKSKPEGKGKGADDLV
jgi:hypothetical protein